MKTNVDITQKSGKNDLFSKSSIILFICLSICMFFSLYVSYKSSISILFQIIVMCMLLINYKRPSIVIVAILLLSVTRQYILGTNSDTFTNYYNFNSKSQIIIIFILFILKIITKKNDFIFKSPASYLIVFGLILLISVFFAVTTIEYTTNYFCICILYILIPFLMKDKEDLNILLVGFMLSGFFMVIGTLNHIILYGNMYITKVMADRNYQAGFLIICIFSYFAFLIENFRYISLMMKMIAIAVIAFDLFIMFSSASRGSIIAIFLGGLFIFVLYARKPKVTLSIATIIGVLAFIATRFGWLNNVIERFYLNNVSNGNGRLPIWESYLNAINSSTPLRWLFGNGFVFKTEMLIVSHNNFIGILYGFGVIGVIIYSVTLLSCFLKTWKSPYKSVLIVLFPAIVMSLTIETFYYSEFVLLFAGAAGIGKLYIKGVERI